MASGLTWVLGGLSLLLLIFLVVDAANDLIKQRARAAGLAGRANDPADLDNYGVNVLGIGRVEPTVVHDGFVLLLSTVTRIVLQTLGTQKACALG